jgi:hypothetical protein
MIGTWWRRPTSPYATPLGRPAHAAVVKRGVERIFDFRRDAVAALLNAA